VAIQVYYLKPLIAMAEQTHRELSRAIEILRERLAATERTEHAAGRARCNEQPHLRQLH
jgi:uncharacterized membrane protein